MDIDNILRYLNERKWSRDEHWPRCFGGKKEPYHSHAHNVIIVPQRTKDEPSCVDSETINK